MPTAADEIIDVLRAEHEVLLAAATALSADQVDGPSGASEWTIAQVLSHLGSGAEITLAGLNAALSGLDERAESFNQGVWDRWNAKSPAEQATDFVPANEALVARYESIDPATRESLRIDLGFLPQPVDLATAAGMRLSEFALHSWDVRIVSDPGVTLSDAVASQLIDRGAMLFGWVSHAENVPGLEGDLAVTTTGPERSFGVHFAQPSSIVEAPAAPGGELEIPAEAWLRLVAGRLGAEHTPGSVRVTGDLVSLDDLRRVFPGY